MELPAAGLLLETVNADGRTKGVTVDTVDKASLGVACDVALDAACLPIV